MKQRETTVGDVLKQIRDEEIAFVDLKFVDLFGGLQHITFPATALDEGSFVRGVNFDGSSVRGFQTIAESDLLLKPDTSTVFRDPFFDERTISLFCDILDPAGYKPYSRDPRGVAQRAARLVRSMGIADSASFGMEMEFYLFDDVRFDQATQHGFYFINSGSVFNTGQRDQGAIGQRAGQKGAYFAAPPLDAFHNIRGKMSQLMEVSGLTPVMNHHEVGAAGQNEIGFSHAALLRAADNAVKFKYVIKNAAHRYGKTATFMPKPLLEQAGSGMHTNVSLWQHGKNVFYEAGRYADLSDFAVHFIGGVLKHARAVCAFSAPTTNSYRRLVPGFEAPIILVYSQRNRSACIRVPFTGTNPDAKRLEFRTPDPSCNPYLSLAAILLAGVDGVSNQIEPPAPVDEDIYEFATSEHGKLLQATPTSLDEALDALEADYDFLARDDVFSEDLIDAWLRQKREKEIKHLRLRPHPTEFTLYFDA